MGAKCYLILARCSCFRDKLHLQRPNVECESFGRGDAVVAGFELVF